MKENFKFDSALTLKSQQTEHFSSILKSGVVLSRKLGVATNYCLIGQTFLTRNYPVYSLIVFLNFYITELIANQKHGTVLS